VGHLRLCLPAGVTFARWKRSQPELLAYLQSNRITWSQTINADLNRHSISLFLYNIPTTGIDLSSLHQMITVQCNLKSPIALRVSTITEQAAKGSCILVECDAKDVPHVTTQIFLGRIGPMCNATYNDHPISRARPMTLSARAALYPTYTKAHRLQAIIKQNELMKNLVRYAFVNVESVDNEFDFNGNTRTLRTIIYNGIVINGSKPVHGIVQTTPGKILISMSKINSSETLNKLSKLFNHLGNIPPSDLVTITGFPDRPRKITDPELTLPLAREYINTLQRTPSQTPTANSNHSPQINYTVTQPTARPHANRNPTHPTLATRGTCWESPLPTIYRAEPSTAMTVDDVPSQNKLRSTDPLALAQAREWLLQLVRTSPQAIRHVNTIVSAVTPDAYHDPTLNPSTPSIDMSMDEDSEGEEASSLPTLFTPHYTNKVPHGRSIAPMPNKLEDSSKGGEPLRQFPKGGGNPSQTFLRVPEPSSTLHDLMDRTETLEHNTADTSDAILLVADKVCALDQILAERIADVDLALESQMATATQALADGLHALGTTATTVQKDLTHISTKQTLSTAKEKVWWAETKRTLVEMQTEMMDDRATTILCFRDIRESLQAMTTMMEELLNRTQPHGTLPTAIATYGNSSTTNTLTPASNDDSVTATNPSNITNTMSTIAAEQDNLAGIITQLTGAVTAMAATNQSQLRSTIDYLTTTTRESSEATVEALQHLSMSS